MWSSSDNKKKEDVEDCSCSGNSGGDSVKQQQQQQLNSFDNNSRKPFSSNDFNLNKDKEEFAAEEFGGGGVDSGFISGPQTSELTYDEDDDYSKKDVSDHFNLGGSNNFNITATPITQHQPPQQQGKTSIKEEKLILDSGCIDDDFEIDEHDESVAGEAISEQKQVQYEQPNAPVAAAVAHLTLQSSITSTAAGSVTSSKSTSTGSTMILKNEVDAGITERFCNLSLQTAPNNNAQQQLTSGQISINNLNSSRRQQQHHQQQHQQQQQDPSAINAAPLEQWEQYYQQNDDGDTYLHLACVSGYDNVVGALIRIAPHPCLLNIQNDDAQTPLHMAAQIQMPKILRMLLLAGAEPTIRDCNGNTALHLACISGNEQCVSALTMKFSASEINEAHRHYGHRSKDNMSYLNCARLPSDLEIRNYNGERCVHLAAQGGYTKILEILVQHGADINAGEGRSGQTPLHIAIENCNEEVANFLLDDCQKQLNLEAATYAGLTAYQVACILNKSQMQSILKKRGAEPLTPPDSDYDSSDIETDLEDSKFYDRFGDPGYFINYNGGNPMTVA